MSEEDRSRIYAWLCDEMDEQRAEYLMSCLSPTPLAELATKADMLLLKEDFGELRAATKADMLALKADFAEFKEDFGELRVQREADRKEMAAQREADRAEFREFRAEMADDSKRRFRWLAGIISSFGIAAVGGIVGFGTAILVAVLQTGAAG